MTNISQPLAGNSRFGPKQALLLLCVVQLLVWTIFPLLGHHSPPLDVVEMHTWAAVPQLGYYKHPPSPAWGIWLSEQVFGATPLALFLPSSVSVVLATLAVWPLAKRFLGTRGGVVALFLQATVAYYNLYSPDFNHNVAQMPVWALAVTTFYFALTDGRLRWWIGFGLALGASMLTKYSAAFLAVACLAMLAWGAEARRHVTIKALAVSALGFFAVFGPHLWWLVQNDFQPIHYLGSRLDTLAAGSSWGSRFVQYLLAQAVVHVAPLCVLFWLRRKDPEGEAALPVRFDDRFLFVLGAGPFLLTLLAGLLGSYLHPMWASAMFPLSGIAVVRLLGARANRLWARSALAAWILFMLLLGATYAAKNTVFWHTLTHKYTRASYPGPEVARAADALWAREAPGYPLRVIGGSAWEAGVASFFSPSKPRVLVEADLTLTPWVSKQEVEKCGALFVWTAEMEIRPTMYGSFPKAQELEMLVVNPDRPGTHDRIRLSTAIVRPTGTPGECGAR